MPLVVDRNVIPENDGSERFQFDDWLERERELREHSLRQGRRLWRRHRDKPLTFWWETFGILPEEMDLMR